MSDQLAPTLLNVACIDGRWVWLEKVIPDQPRWWQRHRPNPEPTYRPFAELANTDLENLFELEEAKPPTPRQPNRAERRAAERGRR